MNKYLNNKNIIITISWILVLIHCGIIFQFSSRPAVESKELSGKITEIIVDTVERVAPNRLTELDFKRAHHLIRKNAHFFAYLILGILVINALRRSGIKSIIVAFLMCVLYAISDEIHQIFIPGRSGEVRDVLIDSLGAMVGILIYIGVGRVFNKSQNGQKVYN